jgi:tripartite-type tricarboxylate transporter receptor subunit TctC
MTRMLAALAVALALVASPPVFAQAYPNKPIRIIVPYTPAGTTDILARLVGQKLSEAWGQPVLIENKPGANGNIGTEVASKAANDGYTVIMGTVAPFGINPSLYKLAFDPVKDFTPITLVALVPNILVVNPNLPAKSVAELIAYAKANPGKLTFGSPGNGSTAHLSGELFKAQAGIDMLHIPYKGNAGVLADLTGGTISLAIDNIPVYIEQARAGKLRALAVSSPKRSSAAPDLPTLDESGLPGFNVSSWFGLYAPAGTPPEIIAKWNAEVARILKMPDVRERLLTLGADPGGNSAEEFGAFTRAEIARWATVVKKAGVKVD